ncbi:hypothetical protein Catovirus_2_133 [Catovirus CTV1]|uniref:Uncharacterized protein n=1 Tax=Catovirus CTV1 TaxID=1977631 RepID=A0A1V0SBY8_9VIRU|nr:hypothetical protein Catovirus_2_133 [Catovirus CTV1]
MTKGNKKINIYQLNGIKNTNKAKINMVGYSFGESYEDEEIMLDKKKKTYIKEIMENVHVKMYKCRMTDDFVSKHRKLPLLYASLFYERKFVTGFLFSVYVYFEILTDTKKIKTLDSLLKTELDGKYTIEIIMDDKTEVINMEKISDLEELVDNIMSVIETDEMKNIVKIEMNKRDEQRRERFGNFVGKKPPEPKYKFKELLKKYEETGDIDDVLGE